MRNFLRRVAAAGIAALIPMLAAAQAAAPIPLPVPTLASLHADVTAAEGVRSVKRLQNSMAHYLEWGLWSDLGNLFTADAVGEFGGQVVRGGEGIAGHYMQMAGRTAAGLGHGGLNTMLIMQPIVTLGPDGRSARATWHEFAMIGRFGTSALWRGGVYENEYRLQGDRWMISRVRYFPQYEGQYETFGHKAPPKWNIPYHFDSKHVGVTVPKTALAALQAARGSADAVSLARRLQRLEDETAVQNLQHSLGYYLDRKHWDDVVDLFAVDGTLQWGLGRPARGAAAIRKALENAFGQAGLVEGELLDRLQFGTVVTVSADGRSASARTLSLGQLGRNGEFADWETGTYENRFVRENGRWKLAGVRYFPRMHTSFDQGWARNATAPLAHGYGAYPEEHFIELSFPHPVTGKRTAWRGRAVDTPVVALRGRSGDAGAQDLPSLARRAHAALAIDAVENLNSSYGYYIDESAWDQMADTFGSTGSKEITGAGVYVGQERVRAVLNRRGPAGGRTPNFFTIHQLVQPVIHVDADGRRAQARLRLFQCGGNADGSSGSWIGGIYENTAIFEDGEWRFGVQDLHHLFNASYRNGWARLGAAALAKLPLPARVVPNAGIQQGLGGAARPAAFLSELPPDRAIRARQYAFPQITEPAFHYRNPVSGRMPRELLP